MTKLFPLILLSLLVVPVASCGVKGRLHSPAQIERIEAKKAAEVERKAREKAEKEAGNKAEQIAPAESE